MQLVCTLCATPVQLHCVEPCGWVVCGNRECETSTYDLDRGLLMMRDGVVSGMAD